MSDMDVDLAGLGKIVEAVGAVAGRVTYRGSQGDPYMPDGRERDLIAALGRLSHQALAMRERVIGRRQLRGGPSKISLGERCRVAHDSFPSAIGRVAGFESNGSTGLAEVLVEWPISGTYRVPVNLVQILGEEET